MAVGDNLESERLATPEPARHRGRLRTTVLGAAAVPLLLLALQACGPQQAAAPTTAPPAATEAATEVAIEEATEEATEAPSIASPAASPAASPMAIASPGATPVALPSPATIATPEVATPVSS